MNIPEKAIEAAAIAVFESRGSTKWPTAPALFTEAKESAREEAWGALEAALPHLLEPIKALCTEADRGQQSYGSMYGKVTTWQLREIMNGMLAK